MRERGPAMTLARGRGARAAALGVAMATGTTTPIPLDTIQLDPLGCYLPALNGFVVPYSGIYDVSGQLGWLATGAGARIAQIVAGSYSAQPEIPAPTGADLAIVNGALTNVLLLAGQLISLSGYQTSGGALNIQANAAFNWIAWELVRPL